MTSGRQQLPHPVMAPLSLPLGVPKVRDDKIYSPPRNRRWNCGDSVTPARADTSTPHARMLRRSRSSLPGTSSAWPIHPSGHRKWRERNDRRARGVGGHHENLQDDPPAPARAPMLLQRPASKSPIKTGNTLYLSTRKLGQIPLKAE